MDSSWYSSKCGGGGPMWQSSSTTPLTATAAATSPSCQLQSQDSQNQNAGHTSYAEDPNSSRYKVMLEPAFTVASTSGFYNLAAPEQRSSILSLLSGPPRLLQNGPQHPLIPDYSSSFRFCPPRTGASLAPSVPIVRNPVNHYLKLGVDTCSAVSSKMVASAGRRSSSCLHKVLKAANVNDQSSGHAKLVNHQVSCGIEQGKGFPSLRAGPCSTPSPSHISKVHRAVPQTSQRVLQANSFSHCQSSHFTSGSPRVFCLHASGTLLLSSTGLLGVVCSCHGLHMSISQFSEHSGLLNVNPGDAVHMDSGETIAQWIKVYFHKFGIRIQEDHHGWDWPEGFSGAAGLVKSKGRAPNTFQSENLLNVPSGVFLSSGEPTTNGVFSTELNTGQKLVNEVVRKNQGNAQDSCNSFNRFIGTSQNNVQAVAANQITEHSMLECSPRLKFVSGQDNGFQASSTYFGSILKSENSFVSLQHMQKSKSPGKCSDFVKFNNLRRGDIQDRTAVSSNFELRLGQPSWQNQTLVSNVPASATCLISSRDHLPKSLLESLTHKSGSTQVMDESRQYFNNVAHTTRSKTTIEQSKINSVKHASESHTAKDADRAEQFHNAAARSSAISTFFADLESPSAGKLQSSASSNMYNGNHVMPKQQLCESLNAAKCDPISLLCMRGDGIETKSNIYEMGISNKNMENDKGTHAAFGAHEMNLSRPTKSVGTLISSYGFGAASHDSCLTTCEKSSHFRNLSDMPADSSDGIIPFSNPEKMCTHGHSGYYDHGFLRSDSSLPMDSGPTLLSQSISVGFSSMVSISVPSRAIMSAKNKGIVIDPCLEDKKLQMLAVRKLVENHNQDQLCTSVGMNQDLRRACNYFSNKIKSSIAIPSKSTKSRDGTLHDNEDAAEFAMKSVDSSTTHWMEGASGKSANVSGTSQEAAWRLGDTDAHCQELHTPNPTKKPSIRPGGGENNIGPSCEYVNCCQRVPYPSVPEKCSCAASEKCLDRNCESIGTPLLHSLREGDGSVSSRTSTLLTSQSDKNCSIPESIAMSVGQVGELVKPNLKQVESNAFQWKDVPCKVTAMGKITCKDRPAELGERKNVEDQISDLHTKCFNRSAKGAEEQKISYLSSKCLAPAITQTSIKVSIEDSCTNYAWDSKCANNHVVDKASGIEKHWSSDDAPDTGENTQFDSYSCERDLIDEGTSEAFPDRSSRSLIDELRLRDSLTMRKVQKEVHSGLTVQKYTKDIKSGKRKRAMKWKRLNASFYSPAKALVDENLQFTGSSERDSYNLVGTHVLIQPSQGRSRSCACSIGPTFKKRRSTLSSSITIGCKRSLHRCYHREGDFDCQRPKRACDDYITTPKFSCEKRFRSTTQVWKQGHCTDAGITIKCNSASCGVVYSDKQVNVHKSITKPIVCGKYGIISNGNTSKPVKILSIGKILKNTRNCTPGEDNALKLLLPKSSKRKQESNQCTDRTSSVKVKRNRGGQCAATCSKLDHGNCVEVMEMACYPCTKTDDDVSHMVEGRDIRYEKSYHVPPSCPTASLEPTNKDDHKRSLNELTTKGKYSRWASVSGMKHTDFEFQEKFRTSAKLSKNAEVGHNHVGAIYSTEISTGQQRSKSYPHLAAYCCVCGNSSNEKVNCLLECNRCLIKVHQACYGISTVPKTHWHCRPCRTGSQNIVCVLCGYGGGAMTRALRSDHMVKCLTNAWNSVTEAKPDNIVSPSEALEDRLSMKASRSQFDSDTPSVIGPLVTAWKKDLQMESQPANISSCPTSYTMVQNSISDSTVKQWVHMVCGLWTPETRCPNVDTMSAFDVSGVSLPKGHLVCSICKCPGGSCIKCRVMDCPTRFHPWCAHQKGLLQSEVEGADSEKVGFYGRCEFHDTQPECSYEYDTDSGNTKCDLDDKELKCARTEGYKGRKRDCLRHNIHRPSNGTAGGLVPQEQLNAWIYINGQKPYTKGFPNLPASRASDIETDCRKEYVRYKQLRGWRHLVVYKSGIHALGLYTSSFILRGAMVVEYVGEIVGLRVADRREGDYQSGKKVQYKSACYFFRIDKEHIIDATHKGGIARFVNHSCLPNCIAKVITVRNEKKVVFFAERDIYPGEEITYDYHFNHEDEGKKIPCLCNAKNCRRYLN